MSEKKIELTQHAEDMLRERSIEADWVTETIRKPDSVEADPVQPDVKRAFRTIPERDGRILRVVYVAAEEAIRVVTAFFDRGKRGK